MKGHSLSLSLSLYGDTSVFVFVNCQVKWTWWWNIGNKRVKQLCSSALQLNLSPQNSHSLTDAFIFSGNPAEIKVGKNLGLMYHQAGDAGHVKISLPIQGGGAAFLYLRYIVRNTYQG